MRYVHCSGPGRLHDACVAPEKPFGIKIYDQRPRKPRAEIDIEWEGSGARVVGLQNDFCCAAYMRYYGAHVKPCRHEIRQRVRGTAVLLPRVEYYYREPTDG